jgi:hypothetical protein
MDNVAVRLGGVDFCTCTYLTLPLYLSLPTDPSCRWVHISDFPKSSSRAILPETTEELLDPPACDLALHWGRERGLFLLRLHCPSPYCRPVS